MLDLTGLPPAPRGIPQIEVTFNIDANGLFKVSAKDMGTGIQQTMNIIGGSALPKDEIDRMRRDAQTGLRAPRAPRQADVGAQVLGWRSLRRANLNVNL